MTLKKTLLLCCAAALLFSYCCKEDSPVPAAPVLPPETQTGANTFGCKVNGEIWMPEVPPNFSGVYKLSADYDRGTFFVAANNYKTSHINDASIGINVFTKFYSTKDIIIGNTNNYTKNARGVYILGSCHSETDTTEAGKLTITKLDTIKRIVSGRFYFTIFQNGCDTVKITDGRFDVKY